MFLRHSQAELDSIKNHLEKMKGLVEPLRELPDRRLRTLLILKQNLRRLGAVSKRPSRSEWRVLAAYVM